MTCIVGIAENGRVYIGGDSAGAAGWSITTRADTKVWAKGSYVFGFTSSFRMGQLLHHALKLPDPPSPARNDELESFMVTTFVDAVRDCLKEGGYAKKDNEVERGGTFLVGVQGRLFNIESDYQVGENVVEYDAVGCGSDLAKGALHALGGIAEPETRIQAALEAAEAFSNGVRGPFTIVRGGAR